MKYTQNFDIQNYEEFLELSHKTLKEYSELFHVVSCGLNGMLGRYKDYCINNAEMKHIVERCNHSFEYFIESIPSLKTEHKKFENYIEDIEEIALAKPKTKINTEVGDWLRLNMLNASEKIILKNIDYLNKDYLQEQLKQINNHVEYLGEVWKDENFKYFAEEITSGSRELVADFKACSNQIKEHVLQNQKELEA